MSYEQHPQSPMGAEAAAGVISAEMVRIHRESYGSGAKSVKTYVHDDLVLSVLDVDLLPAETVVIEAGRKDLVLEMRGSFQLELETSFTAAVERATGRKVIAFLSDTHLDPPFVTELFRLAPAHDVEIPEPTAEIEVDGALSTLQGRYDSTTDAPALAREGLRVFVDHLDRQQFNVLQLIVTELVANAVLHGAAGPVSFVELDVSVCDDKIVGEVRGDGAPFDYQPREPGSSAGFGLLLVERLATRWGVETEPTRVWFEVARADAA